MAQAADNMQMKLFHGIKDAAINAAINADWLSLAACLYKVITAKKPLGGDDIADYRALCKLYKKHTGAKSIPKEWEIDENNLPKYSSTFSERAQDLVSHIDAFKDGHNSMQTQIKAIVSNIIKLFDSISKRCNYPGRQAYREDGFECMFLNELAMWLVIILPRYIRTDKEAVDIVSARISYCEAVQREVLTFKNDNNINNPKRTLDSIIHSLGELRDYLCYFHSAASFQDRIRKVDDTINGMISHTFHILYLMLNGADGNLQVSEFRNKGNKIQTPEKTKILREYLLGKWIEETFEAAGIVADTFAIKKDVSIALIAKHIDIRRVSQIKKIDELGIDEFTWKTDYSNMQCITNSDSTQAEKYLKDAKKLNDFFRRIVELHRSILRMCYIRKILNKGIEVTLDFGQAWLFGGRGKPIFDGLKDVLDDTINCHEVALQNFWEYYYTNTYEPFMKLYSKDKKDVVYNKVVILSQEYYKDNITAIQKIRDEAKAIQNYAERAKVENESNIEKQRELSANLCDYLCLVEGYDQSKLLSLKEIKEKAACPSETQPTPTTVQPTSTSTQANVADKQPMKPVKKNNGGASQVNPEIEEKTLLDQRTAVQLKEMEDKIKARETVREKDAKAREEARQIAEKAREEASVFRLHLFSSSSMSATSISCTRSSVGARASMSTLAPVLKPTTNTESNASYLDRKDEKRNAK